MKSSTWMVIALVTGIVGFLMGYAVSSSTGTRRVGETAAHAAPPAAAPAQKADAGGYASAAPAPKADAGGYGTEKPATPAPAPAKAADPPKAPGY